MNTHTWSKLPNPIHFLGGVLCIAGVLFTTSSVAQTVPPAGSGSAAVPTAAPPPPVATMPVPKSATLEDPAGVQQQVLRYFETAPEVKCDYKAHWSSDERVWVACGPHGLLVLGRGQSGLEAISQRDVGGEVDGFFSAAGRVWVTLLERRALALPETITSDPGLAPAPVTPEPAPPPLPSFGSASAGRIDEGASEERAIYGTVVQVSELDVIISVGSDDGLVLRDRVALHPGGSLVAGGEGDRKRGLVVVGRVVELWDDKARVRVGLNEPVEVGAAARLTKEFPTASRVAPPRIAGVWEIRAIARPFFNLGQVGGGLFTEGSLARRTASWHYGLRLGPLGLGGREGADTVVPWAGHLFGEFDSRLFAAGLGVGAQAVNDTTVERGAGMGIIQSLRLGSVDGLHLAGRTSFVVFRSETEFATFDMQGQLAVGESSWLIGRGGGGTVGYGFGEIALRTLLSGAGGPGSFFLEVAVGGAALFASECQVSSDFFSGDFPICQSHQVGGPMAGLGGEWRL